MINPSLRNAKANIYGPTCMKPTTQSRVNGSHLNKIIIICKSTNHLFDRKQHDWKQWEVKMLCDYQKLQTKSTLPQRTQKLSSANTAWDRISWSWEQSRQLAPLLRKTFPYIFPISDSQLSVAFVSNKCHSTPDEKHHIAVWWFC